jgi:hypothetical protein
MKHLKIFFSLLALALIYPFRSQLEFFIRFWPNLGWLRAACFDLSDRAIIGPRSSGIDDRAWRLLDE